jgi:alanine racemase
MVLNVPPEDMERLLYYDLEAEIYSTVQLLELSRIASRGHYEGAIHLKFDTGMHRLGFEEHNLEELSHNLLTNRNIRVQSIFTHLVGADEDIHDHFSHEQVRVFLKMTESISGTLGYNPMIHVLNSAGITRFPEYQFDMVRLGIGLYGYNSDPEIRHSLQYISTLKTKISQVRLVKGGETIGYGRMGKIAKDSMIATIAIGYADGFSRAFSNGIGRVLVQGQMAPVIGNVCMDMTMIDITGIDAKEGDEVIIFGENPTIETLATRIGTIPYEILTGVNDRVKRVFYTE